MQTTAASRVTIMSSTRSFGCCALFARLYSSESKLPRVAFFSLLLMSAFLSCGSGGSENDKGKPSGHLIEGKFKTHVGFTKVTLEEIDPSGLKPVDSTQISDRTL